MRTPAERLLDDARAANRGRPVGCVVARTPRGEVFVAWDRPERRYEVGTSASVVATGRRSQVVGALAELLERKAAP